MINELPPLAELIDLLPDSVCIVDVDGRFPAKVGDPQCSPTDDADGCSANPRNFSAVNKLLQAVQ